MGRPKGSKNKIEKKKEVEAEEEVLVSRETMHCRVCNHPRDVHYGGEKNWCNRAGCQCQEYQ